jgi:3-methylfumaryl-CoA hydratase
MDQLNVSAWAGRVETATAALSPQRAAELYATLARDDDAAPVDGSAMPLLWHWAAFTPVAQMADLGTDGHPRPGDFLPPMPNARRMWAGGELSFLAPLHVGETLERTTTIRSVMPKTGTGGQQMMFVTLDHEISGEAGLAVRERQDIVYLPMPDRFVAPRKQAAPAVTLFDDAVTVSEALLFRYSAVTFNAHRIHYDLPYATGVEHYPGLVVHGPLQATLLLAAAVRHAGRPPSRFRFRAVHPIFHFETLRLIAQDHGPDAMALCTASDRGHQGLRASAIWEETP